MPFEPDGWQVHFREQLRVAPLGVPTGKARGLYARYDTPDDVPVDLESVLLYNVGMPVFAPLITMGLTCQRGRRPDRCHHHDYQMRSEAPDPGGSPPLARVSARFSERLPASAGQWWGRRYAPTSSSRCR